ncbi:MAG: glycosyltransferase 87 family protein [Acidobacteriaceae bacterium]
MERSRVKASARALIGSALIVSCVAGIFYIYSRPSRNGFGAEHDFVTVIAGVHCAIDRCDPYDSPTLEREFPARMGGYTPSHFRPEWPVYPPGTFLLLFPLSLLPWPVLSMVWMLSCFVSLAAALVVLFLYCKAYRDVLSAIPFVILLADGSIGWAVQLGQPALIAASTLTLAIVALVPGLMPVTGGVLLAISLCLKPQGAYLCALYFLLLARTRVPALAACLFTAAAAAGGMLLFYVRLGSLAYLGHLSANIKLAMQPGRDADFSRMNSDSASFLNLQAFLARFLDNPHLANQLTYAVCVLVAGLLGFVCWRRQNIALRPYTIVAVLVMIQLLGSYHRLYDHAYMLAAIPGLYEIKQRALGQYLLFVVALVIYHFSQLHGLTIHGFGPFPSGAPVELLIAGLCLYSLWRNRPVLRPL